MSFNPYDWFYRGKINITASFCIDDESLIDLFTVDGSGYIATGIDVGTKPWTDRDYYITNISDCLKQKAFFKKAMGESATLTYNGQLKVRIYVSHDKRYGEAYTSQGFTQEDTLTCNTSDTSGNPRIIFYREICGGDSVDIYSKDFAIFSCDCAEPEPIVGYQVPLKIGESSGSSDFDFHLDNKSAKFPSQQGDGGDLRFTLDDGTTLLPFYVENVAGESPNRTAYVWVKIDEDLSVGQNIYCYFYNPNAENASDDSITGEHLSSDVILLTVEEIEVIGSTSLQGTVCDKNGDPITGTAVKIFFFDKDTGELLDSTTSNSEDGSWSYNFGFPAGTKILTVFALEGDYGEDTDIAGAEFLETE